MPVLPARVLLNGDLDGITELALLDLDLLVLALFDGAASTGIRRSLYSDVSVLMCWVSRVEGLTNTRHDHVCDSRGVCRD